MSAGFWSTLTQPIIGLSPMDGVTDFPFRHITKKYGQPAIIYTEFTSVEGVCHKASQLFKDFLYSEIERPIIGQIYGTTPSYFRQTALLLCELGFDGVDINMGCPAKNVAHSGAGAALIKTPQLAQEIIRETKAGIQDWLNGKTPADCEDISEEIVTLVRERHQALPAQFQAKRLIPVSVKTRVGYEMPVVTEWISTLLEMEPAAIAVHGRTLKQQYGGLANWELIGEAAELAHKTSTLLLGNGDVKTLDEAYQKIETYKLDGALLGRAAMGNPFVFQPAAQPADLKSLLAIALEHAQLFEKTFSDEERYTFLPMRKHMGWYIHDIENAAKVRQDIYRCNSSADFEQVLKTYNLI
jgi:tRNA-dihydrouridine synthase B